MTARTLFDKLWDSHVICSEGSGLDLLHIDRSLLTDLSGTIGLEDMEAEGRKVRNPELQLAIPDHAISTDQLAGDSDTPLAKRFVGGLARLAAAQGIEHFERGSGLQGIVHVVGIETGFTLPGVTLVCGDSHTSTHGALGALAWGIGSAEVRHVLATQALWVKRPRSARIVLDGELGPDVTAKDVALWLLGSLRADFGRGHGVEFAGSAVEGMSVESRATLCNLAVELGARFGLVAPDETTFAYLQGRRFAPSGALWEQALDAWRALRSDPGAVFAKDLRFDAGEITPQISWGTSPDQVVGAGGRVPETAEAGSAELDYMGLEPGQPLAGVPIDYVFIGSCANSRIEDLRAAARIVGDGRVDASVVAWVVPGSEAVKRQAEAEGLDTLFRNAGFEWREPGCSMCVGANGDIVPPGKRIVSTSNRNFVGRQGPGARTHLASPAVAAASAIAGHIAFPAPPLPGVAGERRSRRQDA